MNLFMEDFTLQTAENVPLRYDTATVGSRFAACLLDSVIVILIALGALVVIMLSDIVGDIFSPYFYAIFYLLSGTIFWVYFVINEMIFNGSSLGKKALNLKVIKDDGTPIDLVDSLTRNLIRYMDFLPGNYLVGFVVMMLNDKSKRLGDYAAGTLVVRVRSVQLDRLSLGDTPYDVVVKDNPYLSLITPEEYQVMREYLAQRGRLSSFRSLNLAQKLTTRLAEKLHIDPPSSLEECLQLIRSCVKYYK